MPASTCIFCKIAHGDIPARTVYRDDEVVAFHDVSPQAPVHILVIPVRHIAGMSALG
ncbi:MAG: HIT domain-containing protein, partial [Chloroflexi bacterium]|nr:HIT domain-containing protein [Chloroflexota bacterium]